MGRTSRLKPTGGEAAPAAGKIARIRAATRGTRAKDGRDIGASFTRTSSSHARHFIRRDAQRFGSPSQRGFGKVKALFFQPEQGIGCPSHARQSLLGV